MAIIEIIGGNITHKYLMGKTKWDLAFMYMELLRQYWALKDKYEPEEINHDITGTSDGSY